MTHHKKRFYLIIPFLLLVSLVGGACNRSNSNSSSDCPLPFPFCGGSFPLNTQQTTAYGLPWADVTTSSSDWITCFGPYALCYYANCTPDPSGLTADCPCYSTFGTNFVDINAILNNDVYNETKAFCTNDPAACHTPNQAPVCQSLMSGSFMQGAVNFSTFSLYRATKEPIGLTDCTSQPGLYAGCMTAPCFGATTEDTTNGTSTIQCDCPLYDGPFQVGQNNLSCDDGDRVYSAAYNLIPPPSTPPSASCEMIDGCIPDAPPENCGCALYVSSTVTTLPANSGVDCVKVCQEYDSCQGKGNIEVGYTCDATICTSEKTDLILDACDGLQNCDLSEIFKAESAAQCSCCGSQLCGCSPNTATDHKIKTLDADQRSNGETPQCDINGTLCGS